MPISSSSLFHFTNKINNLINILKKGFIPKYCLEYCFPSFLSQYAFPMVCFCDLPLSNIKEHLEFYGFYGIGLKKEWGVKWGINPVLYINPESHLSKYLKDLFIINAQINDKKMQDILFTLFQICNYIKPYSGKIILRNGKYITKKFYDEREWRFLPREAKYDLLDFREFIDKNKLRQSNREMENKHKFSFEPSDVKYIIVKNENEIIKMIHFVDNLKQSNLPLEAKKILSSRIICSEQIFSDF